MCKSDMCKFRPESDTKTIPHIGKSENSNYVLRNDFKPNKVGSCFK